MARPVKMTENMKDKIAKYLSAGMCYEDVARTVGVSSRTIFRWAERDEEFAELVANARSLADDQVEQLTHTLALDPNPSYNSLRIFWLKGRRREVYGETKESASPNVNISINPEVASAMRLAGLEASKEIDGVCQESEDKF